MASTPKLYTHRESGNGYKVRLLAGWLNIKLEEIHVDLFSMEHQTDDFLALDPRGKIPVLVHGGKTFTDSAAILSYLAGVYPDPQTGKTPSSFWSTDAVEQATIIDWLAFSASFIAEGPSNARALHNFTAAKADGPPSDIESALKEAQKKSDKCLKILEKQLSQDDWLVLDRPTIADAACFPYIALAPMGDVSLEKYPAILAWIDRIKKLPGFVSIIGLEDPMYRRG